MRMYVSLPLSPSLSLSVCLYNRCDKFSAVFFWGLDRAWGVCGATSMAIHTSTR